MALVVTAIISASVSFEQTQAIASIVESTIILSESETISQETLRAKREKQLGDV